MKKIVFKSIMMIMVLFGIISCDLLENKTIHLPKMVMQSKIDKKFPMTKNFVVGSLTLENPKVDFKGDRMYIESDYIAGLTLAGSSTGKLYMSTKIKYDVAKESMYLVDFSIDKVVDESGNVVGENIKNVAIVKGLITNFMAINPVYEYRKENPKAKIRIKKMYIQDGKFYVQT